MRKATIHQATTILATAKNVLFPGHNLLLTTSTDGPTVWYRPSARLFFAVIITFFGWCCFKNILVLWCVLLRYYPQFAQCKQIVKAIKAWCKEVNDPIFLRQVVTSEIYYQNTCWILSKLCHWLQPVVSNFARFLSFIDWYVAIVGHAAVIVVYRMFLMAKYTKKITIKCNKYYIS